ncbi:E3 ubiquitin-protein ligase COP1-like [Chironomus tepperi]|uniref:E3 ubiquitin-protein ligase COP1-like n=1 Tax=Chironomus tepperi TaxID=113505 RepID=UPI00391F6A61
MPRRQSLERNPSNSSDLNPRKKMNKEKDIKKSTTTTNLSQFLCPICFSTICEATITRCGHTFCNKCIQKSIDINKSCPKCNSTLTTDQIFPNFLLNELISKHLMEQQEMERMFPGTQGIEDEDGALDNLKSFLTTESIEKLSLPDINIVLDIFTQRKILLEAESITAQNKLLHEFLQHLMKQTEQQQRELEKKIRLIKNDIKVVENILKNVQNSCPKIEDVEKQFEKSTASSASDPSGSSSAGQELDAIKNEMKQLITDIDSSMPNNDQQTALPLSQSATYKIRKQRMFQHFDDFVKCYFTNRAEDLHFQSEEELMIMETNEQAVPAQPTTVPDVPKTSKTLDVFRDNLVKFSKYNQLRTLSTLNYSNENTMLPSTIVSSIEFDKDSEFFAIAGVTKRIKIFDYYASIRDAVVDIKHPINEMICTSKISSICWNSYFKEILAASDYEGLVTVYDVETRVRKRIFQEHDKRCWSVDFNEIDTKLLASGSDDARVKLWSIDCENSVATLEVKTANVCCVKFNPKSSCHLAFGSADHCVHYYDLRNLKEPLLILKGHKKAVSYVKFLNTNEIISAGTDGQLKLWDINKQPYCVRSFVGGHINEKNFVGLATNGDYIACGSEDNSLCIYYKGLSKQLFNLRFDLQQQQRYSGYDIDTKVGSSDNEFVSAVCWKKSHSPAQQSNVIIAGNSKGIIKILELV